MEASRNANDSSGGDTGGIRGALARTLETGSACTGPGDDVSLLVRHRDDGVVERSVYVRLTVRDILFDLLRTTASSAGATAAGCCCASHS